MPHAGVMNFKLAAAAAVLPLAFLAGCGGEAAGVAAGDGPAVTQSPVEGEPTETETADTSQTANFGEKYTYPDRVVVEVIKVQHGKVTAADIDNLADAKKGTPYVALTVRVRNESGERITDAASMWTVTYGPDGDMSTPTYIPSVKTPTISGTILPRKAKVATETFPIPEKYQDDVTLEFGFDYDHPATVFSGSLR